MNGDGDLMAAWLATSPSAPGGLYLVRQKDDVVWWVGFSDESPRGFAGFHQGLTFTNVFRGTRAGSTITGDWASVPRGTTLSNGTLDLEIVAHDTLQTRQQTGGFPHTTWTRIGTVDRTMDIRDLFTKVARNDGGSMAHHMKTPGGDDNSGLYKSLSVIKGTLAGLMYANFPGNESNLPRSYSSFMCASWFHDGPTASPPDGDITFNLAIDLRELQSEQPDFWTDDWFFDSLVIQSSLSNNGGIIHCELLMYGRTAGTNDCGAGEQSPSLLPGWADFGANSVLLNGVPINGFKPNNVAILNNPAILGDENVSCMVQRILNVDVSGGLRLPIRVSGVICVDEHGTIEIHPVYSIDIITHNPGRLTSLTGVWGSGAGTYYVRQVDQTVWWLATSRVQPNAATAGHVFHGALMSDSTGQYVQGDWIVLPQGESEENPNVLATGTVKLRIANSGRLELVEQSGGFSTQAVEKLYDDVPTVLPEIALPNFLRFPTLAVGEVSPPRTLRITNTGPLPAKVSIPDSPPPGANYVWNNEGDHVLGYGESIDVSITFTPSHIGDNSGEIVVESDAIGSPYNVALIGMGRRGGGL